LEHVQNLKNCNDYSQSFFEEQSTRNQKFVIKTVQKLATRVRFAIFAMANCVKTNLRIDYIEKLDIFLITNEDVFRRDKTERNYIEIIVIYSNVYYFYYN